MFYQVTDSVLNWVASAIDKARELKHHYHGGYAGRENQYRATADCSGVEMHHYNVMSTLSGEMKLLIEAPKPKEINLKAERKKNKKGPGHVTTNSVLLYYRDRSFRQVTTNCVFNIDGR